MSETITKKKRMFVVIITSLVMIIVMGIAFFSLSKWEFGIFLFVLGILVLIFERIVNLIGKKKEKDKGIGPDTEHF